MLTSLIFVSSASSALVSCILQLFFSPVIMFNRRCLSLLESLSAPAHGYKLLESGMSRLVRIIFLLALSKSQRKTSLSFNKSTRKSTGLRLMRISTRSLPCRFEGIYANLHPHSLAVKPFGHFRSRPQATIT